MADLRALSFDDLPSEKRHGDVRALDFSTLPDEGMTPLQAGGAFASGFNRSALAGLPGLPVKAALDVADLTRAAYGYAGNKLGVLSPEEMPEPLQRGKFVGSPEWIASQIEANPLGKAAIANPRPDDRSARMLHAVGGAVGASMAGNPRDMAMQAASGIAGQAATEAGADPAWAIVAGMSPQAAVTGGAMVTRGAFRGGERGRAQMEERLQEFNKAGVDPTVGLATGNRWTQAIESLLAKYPGSAGTMANKAEAMRDQLRGSANAVRDNLSRDYGPAVAGEAVKQSIADYRQRQQTVYGRMNDRAEAMIPEGMRFPAASMLARGEDTLAEIPGAPNVSRTINQPLSLTRQVVDSLGQDASPRPATNKPSQILQPNGDPFSVAVPGNAGGLPFEGLKGLKTRVGSLAYAQNPLLADANTGALKHLYGGAKADLREAGRLADIERQAQGLKPGVAAQLDRSDRFYAKSQEVLERVLQPIYRAGDPASEKSFMRIESDLRNSGRSIPTLMASLPLGTRKQVAATVVDRLGKASPGQQNLEGTEFSPATFLANWSRVSPEAKGGLMLGIRGSRHMRGQLDSIARSAEMLRVAREVYSNPSGTSQATNLAGATTGFMSGAVGVASGNTGAGLAAMGGVLTSMALANGGARLMTNPKFVDWLSKTTLVGSSRLQQHLKRLTAMSLNEPDEDRLALQRFAIELEGELPRGK